MYVPVASIIPSYSSVRCVDLFILFTQINSSMVSHKKRHPRVLSRKIMAGFSDFHLSDLKEVFLLKRAC